MNSDDLSMNDLPAGLTPVVARVLRALRGWSQAEMAAAADMDRGSIQRYETDEETPPAVLPELAKAVGVSELRLEHLLLPAVGLLYETLGQTEEEEIYDFEDADWNPEEAAERFSRELAEIGRVGFLSYFAELDRQDREAEAEAWRPLLSHRAEAPELWQNLAELSPDDQGFVIDEGESYHSWALAEHLCHLSAEDRDDPQRAVDLATLAARVAEKVPGPEVWRARVRAYTAAHLVAALRRAGHEEELPVYVTAARKLWEGAADSPGEYLEEARFLAALAGR